MLAIFLPSSAEAARVMVATIFPAAQIARQVTAGRDGVTIETLLPADTGCPHDYAPTPQEIRQLEHADVIIRIGLGLDDFPGMKRLTQPILSLGDLLPPSDLLPMDVHHHKEHANSDHQTHSAINPHVFSSPRLMGQMATLLAEELAKIDPEGSALYRRNALVWKKKMDDLAECFYELGQHLRKQPFAAQYSVFDYLLRDAALSPSITIHAHAGHEPSAGALLSVAREMKSRSITWLLLEPAYLSRMGRLLKQETGASIIPLETGVSSRSSADPDAYEQLMRRNLKLLEQSFAKH